MKIIGFAVLVCLGLAGFGCKTHSDAAKTVGKSKPGTSAAKKGPLPAVEPRLDEKSAEKSAGKRVEAFARYASGISYELNEKGDEALDEFYKSAVANPGNETLVIELATRFAQKKQTDKAIEILQRSCGRTNATGSVFAMLAQIYLRTGKTNAAVQAAETAIKRSPDMLPGYEALANIYTAADKPQESLKVLDRASGQIRPVPLMLISLADQYANFSKLHPKQKEAIAPRAKSLLKRAVGLKPQEILLQQKIADTLAYFGEPKQAAEIYLQLLSAQDESESAVWRDILREKLANIYLMQNDKTNASAQLEGIIRDNPTKYPQAHYILGTIAYDQKDFARAAEHFEKAIILSPELEAAYYDLAGTYLNMNQADRSLLVLDKARTKFKGTFVNEFFTAIAFNKLKKSEEALKHYAAAEMIATTSESNRLDHTFYFQVGACQERVKHYLEAEKYFEKALAKAPNDAETLNYLGYMWAEQGTNLVKARQLIEKAVKLEPKNAAYLDSMGWVLFKANESSQALPYILKAIEFSDEPDAAVYDHLGDIYAALKQSDKAREAWKKSLSIEANDEVKKKLGSTL